MCCRGTLEECFNEFVIHCNLDIHLAVAATKDHNCKFLLRVTTPDPDPHTSDIDYSLITFLAAYIQNGRESNIMMLKACSQSHHITNQNAIIVIVMAVSTMPFRIIANNNNIRQHATEFDPTLPGFGKPTPKALS